MLQKVREAIGCDGKTSDRVRQGSGGRRGKRGVRGGMGIGGSTSGVA